MQEDFFVSNLAIGKTESIATKSANGKSISVEKRVPVKEGSIDSILISYLPSELFKIDKNSYSVNTVVDGDKILLHIVNFSNGGWALIAGCKSDNNQVLAYGETGKFDPDNISNPNIAFWYEMIKGEMRSIEYDNASNDLQTEDASCDNLLSLGHYSYDEDYLWVKLELEPQVTTVRDIDIGHLLETKWGQRSPWNVGLPSYACYTGCVAVAYSQVLYYLHYNLGVPSGLYEQIDFDFEQQSNGYYASNVTRSSYVENSTLWDRMAKKASDTNKSFTAVRDLMIDIGNRLEMRYSSTGAWANASIDVFHQYGINLNSHSYSYDFVKETLDCCLPVVVFASVSESALSSGHAWVIDGYKDKREIIDSQSKWVCMPPDSIQYYSNADLEHIYTEAEKQRICPDIVENEIIHSYSSRSTQYLKMNWGYNGKGDEGTYFTLLPSINWRASDSTANFRYNVQIFSSFTER